MKWQHSYYESEKPRLLSQKYDKQVGASWDLLSFDWEFLSHSFPLAKEETQKASRIPAWPDRNANVEVNVPMRSRIVEDSGE
jgi:hypothetical protein